jgi:hypothetical protein
MAIITYRLKGVNGLMAKPSKQQRIIKWTTIAILAIFLIGTFASTMFYLF